MALLQRQQIEVYYVIPALMRCLAIEMKKKGLKQKRIAELLHIEGAAVSQYVNDKRGNKIEFSKEVMDEICKSSKLIKNDLSLTKELQRLIRLIKKNKEICRIHKKMCDVPKECSREVNCCEN